MSFLVGAQDSRFVRVGVSEFRDQIFSQILAKKQKFKERNFENFKLLFNENLFFTFIYKE